MNKAGQLAIALMCGMKEDNSIVKTLLSEPEELAAAIVRGTKLSQEDMFDTPVVGETFFKHKEFWENLPRVVKAIRDDGGAIDAEAFTGRVILDGKTALDCAIDNDAIKQFFCPGIWQGKTEEMEKSWFSIPKPKRDIQAFRELRRAVAAAGGGEAREDVLERVGIYISSIRRAVQDGAAREINKKLIAAEDRLRIEDILMPDVDGDHALDTRSAWNNFDALFDVIEGNGEKFEPWHFLHKHAGRTSPLESALESGNAGKIFNARVWRDRPQKMMELFERVPAAKRSGIDIEQTLLEIEENSYNNKIETGCGMRKGDLTEIMNAAAGEDAVPVRAIGLKKVWDKIGDIRAALAANGEALGLEELRLTSGRNQAPAFAIAASCGKFSEVVDILEKSGEELDVADLTSKDKAGTSLLGILESRNELDQLVKPELWAHRPSDFKKLWAAMPNRAKDKIDYQDFISRMNLIHMRRRFFEQGKPSPAS